MRPAQLRQAAPYGQRQSSPFRHAFHAARSCRSHAAPKTTHQSTNSSSEVTVRLPNGLELRHFTTEEMNFLYREVFVDQIYLRHGVCLRPGDTVIDVGANTGLFSLLASERVGPTGRVISLEPVPRTFQLLAENVRAHAAWCTAQALPACEPVLMNCGAGPQSQETATFTTYSDSASGWSTMYPDDEEVRTNMRTYIRNLLTGQEDQRASGVEGQGAESLRTDSAGVRRPVADGGVGGDGAGQAGGGSDGNGSGTSRGSSSRGWLASPSSSKEAVPKPWLARAGRALWRLPPLRPLLRAAGDLYVERMLGGQQVWRCPLVPISRVIREQELEKVDLLKIDVERAELDVLAGLAPEDWARVQHLVVEVHDVGGRLADVRTLLADRGFARVVSRQEAELAGSTLHMVYALR